MSRTALLFAFAATLAAGQTITFSTVGTPATIVEPDGTGGTVSLLGYRCPTFPQSSGLVFDLTGLPARYLGNPQAPVQSEVIYFFLEAGSSSLAQSTVILGGTFYLPLVAPIAIAATTPPPLAPSSAYYIGPGDIVCPGAVWAGFDGGNRLGAKLNLSAFVVPNLGALTLQAAVFDPNDNAFYTSNAINFTIQ
jgi:hypothetical protein